MTKAQLANEIYYSPLYIRSSGSIKDLLRLKKTELELLYYEMILTETNERI